MAYSGCTDFYCRSPGNYSYLRCPSCRLLWISPQPTPTDLIRLYERYYDESLDSPVIEARTDGHRFKHLVREVVLQSSLGYPPPRNSSSRLLRQAAGTLMNRVPRAARRARYGLGLTFPPWRGGGRLLDVGCGRGWYVKLMREWGWDAEGVEANPISVSAGKKAYGVPIAQGTLEQQQFPSSHFDAIAIRHVFEHVSDPLATLREILRLLRPGGWLGLATPNGFSLCSRWFGGNWRGATPPWHLHLFGPRSLRIALERSGFKVRKIRAASFPAHWVFTASQQIRRGTFHGDEVASNWGFHALEYLGNTIFGDWGEELEAVAEKPSS